MTTATTKIQRLHDSAFDLPHVGGLDFDRRERRASGCRRASEKGSWACSVILWSKSPIQPLGPWRATAQPGVGAFWWPGNGDAGSGVGVAGVV